MIIIEYHNYKILHNNPIQIIIINVKIIKCILENKYDYYWLQMIYLLIMYSFKIFVLCNQRDIVIRKFEEQRKNLFKLIYYTFDFLSLCYQWFHYIIQYKIYDCRECSHNDYDCTAVKYGRHSIGLLIPGKDILWVKQRALRSRDWLFTWSRQEAWRLVEQ